MLPRRPIPRGPAFPGARRPMLRSLRSLSVASVFVTALASSSLAATPSEWPTFRGPQRTAVAPDTGLLQSWPAQGPPLAWETLGAGRGYSSLAIAGGRIYTLGDAPSTADDKEEYLLCFNQADGKPLWKTK